MEFRKMVTITLYARQQKKQRCTEWSLDSVEKGEGGMIWENDIENYIISYMKQIASLSLMQDPVCLGLTAGYWYTGMTQRDGTGR